MAGKDKILHYISIIYIALIIYLLLDLLLFFYQRLYIFTILQVALLFFSAYFYLKFVYGTATQRYIFVGFGLNCGALWFFIWPFIYGFTFDYYFSIRFLFYIWVFISICLFLINFIYISKRNVKSISIEKLSFQRVSPFNKKIDFITYYSLIINYIIF